jgi:hypothetical protein
MTVKELINQLNSMPMNADVMYVYDSAARGDVIDVYLAVSGNVLLDDGSDKSSYDDDQPLREQRR